MVPTKKNLRQQFSALGFRVDAAPPLNLWTVEKPPVVELDDSTNARHVAWSWYGPRGELPIRYEISESDCLWSFTKLAEAPDSKILDFARRWGVLELCENHGLPTSHEPGDYRYGPSEQLSAAWDDFEREWGPGLRALAEARHSPARMPNGYYGEPVEQWRVWARRVEAVLRLAAQFKVGRAGAPADWELLRGPLRDHPWDESFRAWEADRRTMPRRGWPLVVAEVNGWAKAANICVGLRPINGPDPDKPELRVHLQGRNLFGILVAQLQALLASDTLFACDRCENGYQSYRKPHKRRSLCADCKSEDRRTRGREAVRKHRATPPNERPRANCGPRLPGLDEESQAEAVRDAHTQMPDLDAE